MSQIVSFRYTYFGDDPNLTEYCTWGGKVREIHIAGGKTGCDLLVALIDENYTSCDFHSNSPDPVATPVCTFHREHQVMTID